MLPHAPLCGEIIIPGAHVHGFARLGHLDPGFEDKDRSGDTIADANQPGGIGKILFGPHVLEAVRDELDHALGRVGQERRRDMAEVAHRKLGVALGEGQELVQWCWVMLRHDSDSAGTAMPEQAPLAAWSRSATWTSSYRRGRAWWWAT